MKPTLYMTIGIPASGKTTWAKKFQVANPGTRRVNRDDLRSMLDGGVWSRDNERLVVNLRDTICREVLRSGRSVICDDTNLVPRNWATLKNIAGENGAAFCPVFFTDVEYYKCCDRDAVREKSVGISVLITMCDQLNKIRTNGELQRLADENPNFLNPVMSSSFPLDDYGTTRKEAVVGDAYREPFTMAEWGEARRKAMESGNPLVGGDFYTVAKPTTGRNNPGGGGSSAGVTPRLQNPESLVKPTHALLPKAVMVDIDGTVALKCNRSPYDESKVSQDTSNEAVVELVKTLKSSGYQIVYMSGRTDSCWLATQVWLEKRDIWDGKLFMRRTGDSRKDSIVKEELYRDYVEGRFNVAFVIDDRQQVVDMWRSLGLTCLQCAEGNF